MRAGKWLSTGTKKNIEVKWQGNELFKEVYKQIWLKKKRNYLRSLKITYFLCK